MYHDTNQLEDRDRYHSIVSKPINEERHSLRFNGRSNGLKDSPAMGSGYCSAAASTESKAKSQSSDIEYKGKPLQGFTNYST
ncbi:hypothetical protein Ae201684P_006765 [Aphanomyces euteiches]|uniref:Uncharacterized protein n=1 Tax=Aphanomyces euteiches TaxID=100861 RepID=A0A6G0X831_9STRA|nr:hypothetical protein Ae201684_007257 [Aphanomyces euteiches]KAH9100569.1 hypothetical protein Ae201684P_006765 [Aphanomyces euteiches]